MNVSLGMINPIELSTVARNSSGKVVFPVQRSDSFYAQFKYVMGVPANHSQTSVPLKRLELINNMIVSLNNLNKLSAVQKEPAGKPEIQELGSKIHETLKKMPPAFSPGGNSAAMTGMAFQVSV
jgi:hypothetical protein